MPLNQKQPGSLVVLLVQGTQEESKSFTGSIHSQIGAFCLHSRTQQAGACAVLSLYAAFVVKTKKSEFSSLEAAVPFMSLSFLAFLTFFLKEQKQADCSSLRNWRCRWCDLLAGLRKYVPRTASPHAFRPPFTIYY